MNSHQDVFRSLDLSAYHLMCQQQLSGDNDQRNDAIICAAHLAAAAAKNGKSLFYQNENQQNKTPLFGLLFVLLSEVFFSHKFSTDSIGSFRLFYTINTRL